MNNKHFNYKSSNNKRLITTASIALVLFNVQPAKADDNDEFEEINDIEQKQEEVVTNPQKTEEKTDDEISIASEEIIEYITSLLDIEQTELFNEFLSEESKSAEQLIQALESHATNDFVLADDQYQATIENLSENTSSFIIEIIEVLQEAAKEERNIFDVKALIIESEESEQETEEENIDEENTQEENHQEVEETTNENSQQKEISNVQSGERTPDDFREEIIKSKSVSGAWNLAQEFKRKYPNHELLEEAINHAAKMNLDYGIKLHNRGEYKNSISYYERVINESLIQESLKNEARAYLKQASINKDMLTPEDYYNEILSEKSTSIAWNLAKEFKVVYPENSLLNEAINHAAQMNFDYGMKVHKRGEYKNAASYYNRIINEEKVSATLKKTVQGYLNQANTNSRLMTPKDYYNKILKEKSVSGAWNSAQEFKANFPDDALLKSAMNHAAQMNLDYAIKLHKNSEFSAASSYYERLINEKHTPFSIKNKAELYNYLAISNLHIGESIVNTSKYSTSLSQAINKQLSVKAQTSKEGGGFRDATKDEVAHYINPNNFLPLDSTSLIEALSTVQITTDVLNVRTGPSTMYKQIGTVKKGEVFTIIDISDGWYKISINGETGWISGNKSYVYKNNEILQFLDLSKSMGIPTSELNKYLKGNGILDGTGEAFSKASQQAKINELYLISHALLETGNGKSKLATGILVSEVNGKKVTPKIVYNMFGIGAVDSNPEKYGAERAYQEGWFTPEAAIIGGAKWVGQNYIHNSQHKQNTLYKMRWNPSKPGTHQYATDIGWATKQTNLIISEAPLLAQKYDLVLVFDIPEYQK